MGLFNVMQERDVQVKGYRVRLPLDVLVVASANPEDYTSRGRIITPLKDRYAAQVRTHYPEDPRARARRWCARRRGCRAPRAIAVFVPAVHGGDRRRDDAPGAQLARREPGLGRVGAHVDREPRDARRQRAAARAAQRRAARRCRASRDLDALVQSTAGKLELEYAGEARSEGDLVRDLVRRATRVVFDGLPARSRAWRRWSRRSTRAGSSRSRRRWPSADYLDGLDEIRGLREAAARLAGGDTPARLASGIEFILEGLHLANRLNKTTPRGRRPLRARMKLHRYSRWDGTQQEFSLDAEGRPRRALASC